jgi:erythromycin esterase-like protein
VTKLERAMVKFATLHERAVSIFGKDDPELKRIAEHVAMIQESEREIRRVLRDLARPKPRMSEREARAVAEAAMRVSEEVWCKAQAELNATNPELM